MLPGLVDCGADNMFDEIELPQREALEPGFIPPRVAGGGAGPVPLLDVHGRNHSGRTGA